MNTPAGGFSYTYDSAGRQTGETDFLSDSYAWTYDSNNWLASQSATAAGRTTTADYTYNASGELISLQNLYNGNVQSQFSVPASGGYDGAGDRLQTNVPVDTTLGDYSFAGVTKYAYDGRGELTAEQTTRGSGYNNIYQYDGVSSGTTTGPSNPTLMRGMPQAFNSDNENTASNADGNGNESTVLSPNEGYVNASYDPENRLTELKSGNDPFFQASYTGDSLRAKVNNGGTVTYFLYDGDQPILEMRNDGSGTLYVYAVNIFGPNGLIARTDQTTLLPYLFDMSGNVCNRKTLYDGFGQSYSGIGTIDNMWGYGAQWGGYTDPSGLVLFTHRYYDPATGQWITRDPMGYAGGVDLYGYCGNSPVDGADPSGFSPIILPPGFGDQWPIPGVDGPWGLIPPGPIDGPISR